MPVAEFGFAFQIPKKAVKSRLVKRLRRELRVTTKLREQGITLDASHMRDLIAQVKGINTVMRRARASARKR